MCESPNRPDKRDAHVRIRQPRLARTGVNREEISGAEYVSATLVWHRGALRRISSVHECTLQLTKQEAAPGEYNKLFLQHAAAHLIQLDTLEQRLEVAFAESLVAFALDELEENRTQLIGAENL